MEATSSNQPTNPTEPTRLYTIPESAAMCNCKATTIRKWIREGRLAYVKLGRLVRIERSVLDEFIKANTYKKATTSKEAN